MLSSAVNSDSMIVADQCHSRNGGSAFAGRYSFGRGSSLHRTYTFARSVLGFGVQRYMPEIHGGGLCCFTLSPRIKSARAMRALLHASEAPSQAIHAFSVTTITKFRFLLRPVGSIAYSHPGSLSSLRNSLKHGRRLNSSAAGLYKLFIDPPSYQKAGTHYLLHELIRSIQPY